MIKKVGTIVRYNIFSYLIGEGFRNTLKNKKSTSAALMVMCLTMIVFGIFFTIGENITSIMTQIEAAQGIEAFILDEATGEDIVKLGEEIRAIEGVRQATYRSKEEALSIMKERFGEHGSLLNGYDENNIFPASYVINLTELEKSMEVQEQIEKLNFIDSIQSKDQTVATLISVANGVRIATAIVLVLLVIISTFIIANTIKLTVHARRKEISIMKYVGATNNFIRWPFIVEGIIIGVLASALSIVLVGFSYNVISNKIEQSQAMGIMNLNLVTFSEMFNLIIVVYLILGIGIGVLGSVISMRRYLKV